MKIFVAGATAPLAWPLVRMLCGLGHQGTGMTRAGARVGRVLTRSRLEAGQAPKR
jgi:hypothetical protein